MRLKVSNTKFDTQLFTLLKLNFATGSLANCGINKVILFSFKITILVNGINKVRLFHYLSRPNLQNFPAQTP